MILRGYSQVTSLTKFPRRKWRPSVFRRMLAKLGKRRANQNCMHLRSHFYCVCQICMGDIIAYLIIWQTFVWNLLVDYRHARLYYTLRLQYKLYAFSGTNVFSVAVKNVNKVRTIKRNPKFGDKVLTSFRSSLWTVSIRGANHLSSLGW